MKQTLTVYQVATALRRDEYARWSAAAALALADYYTSLDEDCGTDTELDVVAIRCTWAEYDSLKAWAKEYGLTVCKTPKSIEKYLDERHTWLKLDSGHVLVMNS
jgi:hypothetical protein